MRRKLVKIGESTLMISLPREWVIANNLHKGDEIEVEMDQDKLHVWTDSRVRKERLRMDVTEFRDSLPRLLYALYRSGIDELELLSKDPKLLEKVKSIIWKEAVGFEIIDQKSGSCKIVSVSGKVDDFEQIVRRLFFVTLTMGEESIAALRKQGSMENIIYLEQENNRLTNVLIRAMNKYGSHGNKKVGPLYYIVQELEKTGDQLKYLAQYIGGVRGKWKIRPAAVSALEHAVALLRTVYELFYKFEQEKSSRVKESRNQAVRDTMKCLAQHNTAEETMVLHHALNILTRSFDMLPSIFILRVPVS